MALALRQSMYRLSGQLMNFDEQHSYEATNEKRRTSSSVAVLRQHEPSYAFESGQVTQDCSKNSTVHASRRRSTAKARSSYPEETIA